MNSSAVQAVQTRQRPAATRPGYLALAWIVVFLFFNLYWYAGGTFVNPGALPDPSPRTATGWIWEILVMISFPIGIWACLTIARGKTDGPFQRVIAVIAWFGCAVLAGRGLAGMVDDLTRLTGLSPTGITGLTLQQEIGSAHPSARQLWSGYLIDANFLVGALLFWLMAHRYHQQRSTRSKHA